MGDEYLLPSIAVVVVGGTLITGGRGHYLGMLGGVLLLTALQTLLAGTTLPYATRAIIYRAGRSRCRHGAARTARLTRRSRHGHRAQASASPTWIAAGLRVLVTAGASGIGRAIVDTLIEHGAQGSRLRRRRAGPGRLPRPRIRSVGGNAGRRLVRRRMSTRLFDDVRGRLRRPRRAGQQCRHRRADRRRRGDRPRRLAALHRHRPDRPVPVRAPRRAAAQGRRRRRRSSTCPRPPDASATPSARPTPPPSGASSASPRASPRSSGPHNIRVNAILPGIVEGPRIEGVIGARAEQLGVTYEEMEQQYLERVSLRRMVTAAGRGGDGAVPALAAGPQRLGPVARRRRQCRDAVRQDGRA